MRIYTYKQLYKPGLKKQKNISETIYPKIDITENMCDHFENIDNYQSIYVNFSIFLCML